MKRFILLTILLFGLNSLIFSQQVDSESPAIPGTESLCTLIPVELFRSYLKTNDLFALKYRSDIKQDPVIRNTRIAANNKSPNLSALSYAPSQTVDIETINPVTAVDYKLIVVKPDPAIDYKLIVTKPNPSVDYRLRVVKPSLTVNN